MNRNDLLNQIKSKQLNTLYILDGEEVFLKQGIINTAVVTLVDSNFKDLNVSVLSSPTQQTLLETAQTLPWMGEYRIVIVYGFSVLDAKKTPTEEETAAFLSFAQSIPSSTLVFICLDTKMDSRKKITKALQKHIITCEAFKKDEAIQWVLDYANQHQVPLKEKTAQKINFMVGNDASTLKNEMDKYIALADGKEITNAVVDAIASQGAAYSLFQIFDYLLSQNIKQALFVQQKLIKNGENEYMLFAMLLRECRQNYYIKALSSQHKSSEDIARIIDSRGFIVQKRLALLSKINFSHILKAYTYCIQTDFAIKQGKISQNGVLERTLMGVYATLFEVA